MCFIHYQNGIRIINKLSIYNRYHKLIFERNNFEPNCRNMVWEGKSNQQLLDTDAYVYAIEATCYYGRSVTKTGTVILIR